MTTAQAIHGYEIIGLIDSFPQGIRLGQLFEVVAERFGEAATFHTSAAAGMDFDALLFSLEAREKVRISRGVVYPGGSDRCATSPTCSAQNPTTSARSTAPPW